MSSEKDLLKSAVCYNKKLADKLREELDEMNKNKAHTERSIMITEKKIDLINLLNRQVCAFEKILKKKKKEE